MHDLPLQIDVHAVKELLDSDENLLLIDCREADEYARVRIDGSKHLPMKETPQRVAEFEPYRNGRVVIYCHHGSRSLQVTQWLREHGFTNAQNMMGGIDAWALVVDTSLPRY